MSGGYFPGYYNPYTHGYVGGQVPSYGFPTSSSIGIPGSYPSFGMPAAYPTPVIDPMGFTAAHGAASPLAPPAYPHPPPSATPAILVGGIIDVSDLRAQSAAIAAEKQALEANKQNDYRVLLSTAIHTPDIVVQRSSELEAG